MLLQAFCKMETGFREIPLPPGCREAAGEGRSPPKELIFSPHVFNDLHGYAFA